MGQFSAKHTMQPDRLGITAFKIKVSDKSNVKEMCLARVLVNLMDSGDCLSVSEQDYTKSTKSTFVKTGGIMDCC